MDYRRSAGTHNLPRTLARGPKGYRRDGPVETREVLAGDFTIYSPEGTEIGGMTGYAVKRATRASLLSAAEGIQDLLYEIIWRGAPLEEGMKAADFLPSPTSVVANSASIHPLSRR